MRSRPAASRSRVAVASSGVSGVGGPLGQPLQVKPPGVTSVPVTIVEATLTPTPVEVTTVSPPYPNPSTGGPVNIDVYLTAAGTVNVDVFTTAFRRVDEFPQQLPEGKSTIQWDLKDKFGNPVANGLYYLRVQVTGAQGLTKILKVLVLR